MRRISIIFPVVVALIFFSPVAIAGKKTKKAAKKKSRRSPPPNSQANIIIGVDPPAPPLPPPGLALPPPPPQPAGPELRGMPGLQTPAQSAATFPPITSEITLPSCTFNTISQTCKSSNAYLVASGEHADDIPFGGR